MKKRITASFAKRITVLCLLASAASPVHSQEWSRFRGPDGTGIGTGKSIPLSFEENQINWQIDLPGKGHSSPVLWGEKIFLTCVDEGELERQVICLDASDGELLWSWSSRIDKYHQHRFNSFAASTPAVDGERVYIGWISGERFVMLSLSLTGELLWEKELGDFDARHGAGASPIVLDGTVIAGNDSAAPGSFLIGLDAETGGIRWKQPRKSEMTSYITPAVYRPPDSPPEVIFVSAKHGISSIDPRSGKLNWETGELFTLKSVSSPTIAGNIIFATAGKGGGGRESAAVKTTPGKSPEKAYSLKRNLPYVPTPIAIDNLIYILSDSGMLTCVEAHSGKNLWEQKLEGKYYASPVAVDKKIYCISREGHVCVVKASRTFAMLAESKLPEGTHATPAIANGCMYVRTYHRLISVGERSNTP